MSNGLANFLSIVCSFFSVDWKRKDKQNVGKLRRVAQIAIGILPVANCQL